MDYRRYTSNRRTYASPRYVAGPVPTTVGYYTERPLEAAYAMHEPDYGTYPAEEASAGRMPWAERLVLGLGGMAFGILMAALIFARVATPATANAALVPATVSASTRPIPSKAVAAPAAVAVESRATQCLPNGTTMGGPVTEPYRGEREVYRGERYPSAAVPNVQGYFPQRPLGPAGTIPGAMPMVPSPGMQGIPGTMAPGYRDSYEAPPPHPRTSGEEVAENNVSRRKHGLKVAATNRRPRAESDRRSILQDVAAEGTVSLPREDLAAAASALADAQLE